MEAPILAFKLCDILRKADRPLAAYEIYRRLTPGIRPSTVEAVNHHLGALIEAGLPVAGHHEPDRPPRWTWQPRNDPINAQQWEQLRKIAITSLTIGDPTPAAKVLALISAIY